MASVFNLEGRLGLNVVKFKNKLNEAKKGVSTFKKNVQKDIKQIKKSFRGVSKTIGEMNKRLSQGIAIAAAGFGLLTIKATQSAEQIGQLASTTNSTVKEIQSLTMAFSQYKLEADDVGDVLNTITDRAQDAKDGMQSYVDDFRLVGIEVDDLKGKRPAELFNTFADAVAKTNDPVKRNSAIVRILGDDLGRKLAPALMGGSRLFKELAAEAERAGIIMNAGTVQGAINASRSLEKLKNIVGSGVNKVFAKMGPFIESANKRLINFINDSVNFDTVFNKALFGSIKLVGTFADAWRGIEIIFAGVKVAAFGFTTAFTGALNGILSLAADFGNAIKNSVLLPLRFMIDMAAKLPGIGSKFKALADEINNFEFKPPKLTVDAFNSQIEAMKQSTVELQELLLKPLPSEGINEWVEGVKAATLELTKAANEAEVLRIKLGETSTSAGEDFTQMKKDAEVFGNSMRSVLGSEILNVMKGNFDSMGDAFISMLQRMVAQAIAADIAGAIGLGGTGGSGGASFISGALGFAGGIFGGGGSGALGPGMAGPPVPAGFANGGTPSLNRAAIVGEKGPELFVPRQNGTVVPNNKMGGAGGNTVTNNFNISTPDAASFKSSRTKIINDMARTVRV
jgi:hypothetical protein